VDGLQITEKDAIELARNRWQQGLVQQRQQVDDQRQQSAQQEEIAKQAAINDIDKFVKQMAGTDIDYPVIEEILGQQIQRVIANAQPQQWRGLIETMYHTIKATAGRSRQPPPAAAGNMLRPSGASSAQAAPRDGYEAMWRQPRPAGA
jgi:hypothetical protein